MKNLFASIITTMFLLTSFNGIAQHSIEVISNGDVRMDGSTLTVDKSLNRVGIKTTSPSEALDVNGNIKTNELRNRKSGAFRIRTNHGIVDVGANNSTWCNFSTDRAKIWINRSTTINGHLYPTGNNSKSFGANTLRWNRGYFNTIYRVSEQNLSDRSIKERFRKIDGPLNIINQLDGQLYDYKLEAFMPTVHHENIELNSNEDNRMVSEADQKELLMMQSQAEMSRKDHYGFIAQDVKEILPSIVEYDEETGLHSMNYSAIIPILVEAVKEQQKQIEELKQLIEQK